MLNFSSLSFIAEVFIGINEKVLEPFCRHSFKHWLIQALVSSLEVVFAALPTEDSRCFKTQCSFQSKIEILIILRHFIIPGLFVRHCSICS